MDPPDQPAKTSILVAEDSRIQAKVLEGKLLEAGYEVRVAEDGALALEQARARRPAVIISDIEMPRMNGYEFCRAVKSDAGLRTIPFILLSTLADPQDIIRGLHCGADSYVVKPYDPAFLISRVESLLATPIGEDDEPRQRLEVTLAGERFEVDAGRQQVLNLLVSTFENAVKKNSELLQTNQELTLAKESLAKSNDELSSLNTQLERVNRRMSQDLDAAARVQQSLLPASLPETSRVRFAWKYKPCDELAGDFLNFFELDDKHIAAFVVDVSGHGVASSLLSVAVGRVLTPQVSASSLLMQEANGDGAPRILAPVEVARELNRRFQMEEQDGLYFTLVYGILNVETLEFHHVLAGHPRVVRLPRSGSPVVLDSHGMAVGWFDDIDVSDHVSQLEPGDRLYMYSDGVPEAMDAERTQFGEDRMLEVIELGRGEPLDTSVSLLMDAVERWGAAEGLKDDVSILAMEIPEGS
jgi:sigma-B regulation protein RsbU (phosphoserine phosphatase)